jgi:hypothetical protein
MQVRIALEILGRGINRLWPGWQRRSASGHVPATLYPMPVRSRDYSGGDPPANRPRGSRAFGSHATPGTMIYRHAAVTSPFTGIYPRSVCGGRVAVCGAHDGMSGSAARGQVQSFSSATSKLPPSRGASRPCGRVSVRRARCPGRSIARDQSACRPAMPNDARLIMNTHRPGRDGRRTSGLTAEQGMSPFCLGAPSGDADLAKLPCCAQIITGAAQSKRPTLTVKKLSVNLGIESPREFTKRKQNPLHLIPALSFSSSFSLMTAIPFRCFVW